MAEETKPPPRAYLVSPGGETVRVPVRDADALMGSGWSPASEAQADAYDKQERYSSVGQQLGAGAEAFARGATVGLSTPIELELGLTTPEDIRAREEANPGVATASEAAGFVAPLLVSGGSAGAAKAGLGTAARGAAEYAPATLLSKAGGAVARGVEEAIAKKATGALGQVGAKVAGTAAQGFTEGALLGAGNVIHEEALGNPNLTAQSALEEIGLSAVLGGGLGVAGGALGALTKQAAKGKLGEKIAEWLPNFEGERNLKAAGAISSDLKSAGKRIGKDELRAIGREAGELGLVGPFSTPARTLEKANALLESAGKKMGDLLDAADGAMGAAPRPMADIAARARKEVVSALEDNPLRRGTAKQLDELLGSYEAKFGTEGRELGFRDLHGIRKQLDEEIYGLRGVGDPQANALKTALHDFRSIVSDEINKGMEASGLGSAVWKAANRENRVAATIKRFAESGAERATGNNPLGLLSVMSGLTGFVQHGIPGGTAMALGTELAKRFGSGIGGAAAKAVRESGTLGALTELATANQTVAKKVSELAGAVVTGGRAAAMPRLPKESTVERIEKVRLFANDITHAQETLSSQADGIAEHAPRTAEAFQMSAARAAAFLNSKAPVLPPPTALGRKPELSSEEKWKFDRYYEAVNQPTRILEHAVAGTLTPMDVEAVKTVYPELYDEMTKATLEKVMAHKGEVPYRRRLMLSILLGQDLDGTMTPEAIQANQAAYARPSQKSPDNLTGPAATGKVTQGGLQKLTPASRFMTPTQGAEMREANP